MTRPLLLAATVAAALTISTPLAAQTAGPIERATQSLADLAVVDLQVISIEDILIVRGKVRDLETFRAVEARLADLGYPRVANLMRVVPLRQDDAIAREAERTLSIARGLDGARIHVTAENGVVTIEGTVRNELQRNTAAEIC